MEGISDFAPTVPAVTIIPRRILVSFKTSLETTWGGEGGDNSPSGPQATVASIRWNNIHKSIPFWAEVRPVGKSGCDGLKYLYKPASRIVSLFLINPLDTIMVSYLWTERIIIGSAQEWNYSCGSSFMSGLHRST